MNDILTVILGGGKGTRLYPLTADRSKPACPFGGKYRLVDIPISNSINSGFRKIYVLTQFNSASLHLHIGRTYNFDPFSKDFCEILAAEQTFAHEGWYGGTADAVRKNLAHFRVQQPSHYIILSGDQLYRMDLRHYMKQHLESGAQVDHRDDTRYSAGRQRSRNSQNGQEGEASMHSWRNRVQRKISTNTKFLKRTEPMRIKPTAGNIWRRWVSIFLMPR